jgi:hypothetical protein
MPRLPKTLWMMGMTMAKPPGIISHQISYEESQAHTTRLRKIALHSADVLPHEVAAYLKAMAKHGPWTVKEAILEEYGSLVEYLPKEFVDFVLSVLIQKRQKRRNPYSSSALAEELHARFGIEDHGKFLPPAHVQGPFLALLLKHEDEGLRLIHTLTNTAVARWRERLQLAPDPGWTPLPVIIHLSSGARTFWGDQQVYYWFRPNANGSYVVISALMALEFWMEQQIESGRTPEELFDKVLSGSECVAVLGLCLGIALAYPKQCLKAALPLMCSPAVWFMDVGRVAADATPSFDWDPLGRDKHILALRAERDKRPQRSHDVRNLACYYVFSQEEALRVPFEQAIEHFTEDLPFLYEGQRTDAEAATWLRERMENLQIHGLRGLYRKQQTEEGVYIWVEQPEHLKARNAARLAPIQEQQSWFGVSAWARRTIEGGKIAEGMTLEEAVRAAQTFQREGDFSAPYSESSDVASWRLQAIAGVAAAVVLVDFAWAQEHSVVAWSRDILLAAARMPCQGSSAERYKRFPFDPWVSAGWGLGALVAHGEADASIREQVLRLVAHIQLQVVDAVFLGLYDAWTVDPTLCWNALSLGLALSLPPRQLT